jgi:hypothetical protein
MKTKTLFKSTITTVIGLTLIAGTASAKKPWKRHHKDIDDRNGKNAALIEERIINEKDIDIELLEECKDKRSSDINTYHSETLTRIKAMQKSGKITEVEVSEYKSSHEAITRSISDAKKDGTMTSNEIKSIRKGLDDLNDTLTVIAGDEKINLRRTPVFNRQLEEVKELADFGTKSGRLSTAEASKVNRDLESLEKLEQQIKEDQETELSTKEREKLFQEIIEIREYIKKSMRD